MTQTVDLSAQNLEAYVALFGMNDQNIALIEHECRVTVSLRGSTLVIDGEEEDAALAGRAIQMMLNMIRNGEAVDRFRIRYALSLARERFTPTRIWPRRN